MEKRNLLVVSYILIMSTLMITYFLYKPEKDQRQETMKVVQSEVVQGNEEKESEDEIEAYTGKPQVEEVKKQVKEDKSDSANTSEDSKNMISKSEQETEKEEIVVENEIKDTVRIRIGKAKTKALNVRKKPVKDAKVVLIIEKDTQFEILSETFDGWYEIDVDGVKGYAYSEYITLVQDDVES